MHFVRDVKYLNEYRLILTFENGIKKIVDMKPFLEGEIFEPLKDLSFFQKVCLNKDLDTIAWENDADVSPDFLYEVGIEKE